MLSKSAATQVSVSEIERPGATVSYTLDGIESSKFTPGFWLFWSASFHFFMFASFLSTLHSSFSSWKWIGCLCSNKFKLIQIYREKSSHQPWNLSACCLSSVFYSDSPNLVSVHIYICLCTCIYTRTRKVHVINSINNIIFFIFTTLNLWYFNILKYFLLSCPEKGV